MKPAYFLLIILCALSVKAQEQDLVLVSSVWPPFADMEGQKSFAIEIVDEALNRSNIVSETVINEQGSALDLILDGTYSGSHTLWKTADRESYLYYSEPYLENRLVLLGRKGSDVSAGSLKDLKNKRVSIVSGYGYGSSIYTIPGVTILPGEDHQKNLEMLLEGKTDYMLVDELLIQFLLQYRFQEVKKYLEIGNQAMLVRTLHLAISKKHPNAEGILEAFNNSIHEMISDGTYNRILEINWIQHDVDGDGILELVMDGEHAGEDAPVNYYQVMSNYGLVADADRYYINGVMYDNWNSVPAEFKKNLINTGANYGSENSGIKLKF